MDQAQTAGALRRGSNPEARILGYTAAVGALAAPGVAWVAHLEAPSYHVPTAVLVVLFVLADRVLSLNLTIREETHSLTCSEIPICIGLFAAEPRQLILAAAIAALIGGVAERPGAVKVLFNTALGSTQVVVALVLFHALAPPGMAPTNLRTWIAATVAALVADLASAALVRGAIWCYRGVVDTHDLARTVALGSVASFAKTCAGMLAVELLYAGLAPATALLLVVIMATLLAFRWSGSLHDRYRRLGLLYGFTRVVGRSVQTERIIAGALDGARELLNAECAELVVEDGSGTLVRWRVRGDDDLLCLRLAPDARNELWSHIAATGESVLAPAASRPEWDGTRHDLNVGDFIAAPLHGDRGINGMLLVGNRRDGISTFDEDDHTLFEVLANHTSVALQNGHLVEELQREAAERSHRAAHDSLTGLANRTRFLELADEALTAAAPGALVPVLLIGLDHFKEVNDTLGHSNGDRVLQEVATRLTEALAGSGVAARVSGDEFAVLLHHTGSAEEARRTGERLAAAIGEPIHVSALALGVGASLGLAVAPEHGNNAATLLQRADVAMYLAKYRRSGFELYEAASDPHSPRRLALAYQLRQALDRQELTVHYQPKMDLRTRRIVGAEALVRWIHPEFGTLPPDEFIPVAEKTGLIDPLTTIVLDEALAQRQRWAEAGLALGIAVNVSVRTLGDPWLPEKIAAALAKAGCPAEALTIEITESQLMADVSRAAGALERISDLGVAVSIDDFGTGFSSLSSLRALPLHEIKIDKSFVLRLDENDNDAVIVRSTAELGRNLGLRVVAEGVENERSLDILTEFGVDVAQGYLLSKPLSARDFERWIAGRNRAQAAVA